MIMIITEHVRLFPELWYHLSHYIDVQEFETKITALVPGCAKVLDLRSLHMISERVGAPTLRLLQQWEDPSAGLGTEHRPCPPQ